MFSLLMADRGGDSDCAMVGRCDDGDAAVLVAAALAAAAIRCSIIFSRG